MNAVDLLHPGANDNPGGIATAHGYAMFSDLLTIQQPDALDDTGATFETIGSIATPHVFVTAKNMHKIYSTENKGNVSVKATGEIDGTGARSEFKFYHPGSRAQVDGFVRWWRNNVGIFFPKEADGTVRQIGSADFPAHLKVNYDTGGNNDAYRGYEMTVSAFGEAPIYVPGLMFTPAV